MWSRTTLDRVMRPVSSPNFIPQQKIDITDKNVSNRTPFHQWVASLIVQCISPIDRSPSKILQLTKLEMFANLEWPLLGVSSANIKYLAAAVGIGPTTLVLQTSASPFKLNSDWWTCGESNPVLSGADRKYSRPTPSPR